MDPIILALIAALAPTIAGIAAVIVALRTHRTVNSRMDTMLKLMEAEAYARGRKDQVEEDAPT